MDARLRAVEGADDHVFLVALHNDPAVLHNLTHPQPITLAQHVAWWARVVDDPKQLRQIYTISGARVGCAKFYDIDEDNRSCVLGADIHKHYRGRGLARPLWTLMLDHCFDTLNLHRVSLTTASYNAVAQHVYTRLGFLVEGRQHAALLRDGVFHDVVCMYMLREMWRGKP